MGLRALQSFAAHAPLPFGHFFPPEELFLPHNHSTTIDSQAHLVWSPPGPGRNKVLGGEMVEFLKGCLLAALVLVPIIVAHRATESLDLDGER